MDYDENKSSKIKAVKILIINSLRDEIFKTFKKEALKVYSLIDELKQNPNKGKVLGHVSGISIRELKYKSFRFYYIIDAYKLNLFNQSKLQEILIRFIEMSKKNDQQKTIEEIKFLLSRIKLENLN